MSESTELKVGVPGDTRLEKLNVEPPKSWFAKLPVVRDLKIAVGWQKGILVTGLVLTAFFLIVAVFAPWIAPYGYAQIKDADGVAFPTQAPPSKAHIWGTTVGGFDVFSRTVWGARTAVIAIVGAVLLSIFAGVFLGLVSGYFGGWIDRVLVVIAGAVYSFPSLLLAILMAIMISGGQRQRASLARAIALKPSLLIADEPTSALDVSVQAKVLELFKVLQAEIGFACLLITHDLAVVDMLADRIMVMHKGRIVEHGDASQIMRHPSDPYTKKLLASLPVLDPREQAVHREELRALLAKEA